MAESWGITSTDYTRKEIFASDFPHVELPVTVESGAGVLSAGTLLYLKRSTGKYNVYALPTAVTGEVAGTGDGTTKTFNISLSNQGVIPGTVVLRATIGGNAVSVYDNGKGELADAGGSHFGTIDYLSGSISVTFATAPDNTTNITADYEYAGNTDGAENPLCILAVDVDASTADVKATAYFAGHFRGDKLTPDISSSATTKRILAEHGIFVA